MDQRRLDARHDGSGPAPPPALPKARCRFHLFIRSDYNPRMKFGLLGMRGLHVCGEGTVSHIALGFLQPIEAPR